MNEFFFGCFVENFENAAISVRESSLIIISTGNDNVSKDSKSFFTPAFLLKYCMTKVATGNSRVAEDLHCLRIDFGGSPFAVTSGGKQLPTTEGLSKGFHLFERTRSTRISASMVSSEVNPGTRNGHTPSVLLSHGLSYRFLG